MPDSNTPPGDSRTFVDRWSRRKHAKQSIAPETDGISQAGELPVAEPMQGDCQIARQVDDDVEVEQATSASAPDSDSESNPGPPALPALDTLGEESDFSGFLHPDVDKQVRKTALRMLFSLPQFGVRDGLDDYDDDFTVFEPLGDTVTADMRFHEARKRAELEAKALEADSESATDLPEITDQDTEPDKDDPTVEVKTATESEERADTIDPSTVTKHDSQTETPV